MTTTQPTFNQVLDLACMLPYVEQQRLIDSVQINLDNHLEATEELTEERKARLREAYRQAMAGEVYSQEESEAMMDKIVDELIASATL